MRKSLYRLHPRASARDDSEAAQRVWIVFGGRADQPWLRVLSPGFRHCFAAIEDEHGWMIADPLSGRLLLGRLALPPGFDLPRRYALAGLVPVGPFTPGAPRRQLLPLLLPYSCVVLCRQILGAGAPFALTPWGLFRALAGRMQNLGKNT